MARRARREARADWSDEDIAGFADYLERFNTSIERLQRKPWPRP
jgi:hypothetical protein